MEITNEEVVEALYNEIMRQMPLRTEWKDKIISDIYFTCKKDNLCKDITNYNESINYRDSSLIPMYGAEYSVGLNYMFLSKRSSLFNNILTVLSENNILYEIEEIMRPYNYNKKNYIIKIIY